MGELTDTEDVKTEDPRVRVKERKPRRLWRELPVLVLIALIIALVVKAFLFQPFWIPSRSMVPTLRIDDRVMVSKISYRLSEVARGDIVVFRNPDAEEDETPFFESIVNSVTGALGIHSSEDTDLIKRVIAIGGDEIEIRDNTVFLNGRALDEPYLLPGNAMSDMPARTIPLGTLWVMGDNRSESRDSRVFGPIAVDDVVGKAIMRIWPPDRFGGL